jgi:tRNA dimethylallyltransferase
LGVRVAQALGGIVVNTDSMQVYCDLHVLSARPSEAEMGGVPHRLYGHVDGAVNYSVGHYMRDAVELLDGLAAGTIPVFVGGTGLYFKALTTGLSEIPPVPDEVREKVRRESEGVATPDLHRLLMERDPETGQTLRSSDRLRVQRALEIFAATGRPLVSFHGERRPGPLGARRLLKLFLSPERDELRRRINARFDGMIEVRALGDRKLDPMLPVMRAHGVPGLLAHLRGDLSLQGAIAKGQADTRAYAKRQFTWFRYQLPDWTWVAPEEAETRMLEGLATFR